MNYFGEISEFLLFKMNKKSKILEQYQGRGIFERKIKVVKLFREKKETKKVKNRWRLIEQGHCRPTKNSG